MYRLPESLLSFHLIFFEALCPEKLEIYDTKGVINMEDFRDIVKRSRSYRRFYESKKITIEELEYMIDCARMTPSAQNLQPLRYIIVTGKDREKVFPHCRWAAYLKDWDGPEEGERPSAYIVILSDALVSKNVKWDHGIAAQTILLAAAWKNMGGCIVGSVDRESLSDALRITGRYVIELVIALGYPKEHVVIDEISQDGDIKYFRDKHNIHHVPKRSLRDIIIKTGA